MNPKFGYQAIRGVGCESDVMDGQGGELLLGLRLFHVALFLPWLRTGSAHPLKELRSPCAFVFAGSPAADLLRVSVATRNPRWLSTPPPITSLSFKEPDALRRSAGARPAERAGLELILAVS